MFVVFISAAQQENVVQVFLNFAHLQNTMREIVVQKRNKVSKKLQKARQNVDLVLTPFAACDTLVTSLCVFRATAKKQFGGKSMNIQELFDKASKIYDHSIGLVNVMSEAVKSAMPDFEANSARCQFDIILQYVLLRTALADGKFEPVEGEFIDKITDSYDILRLFKDLPEGLNWRSIAENASISDIASIIDVVGDLAKEHMEVFAQVFALLDASSNGIDELKLLSDDIVAIAACFSFLDDNGTNEESQALTDTLNECLLKPWIEMYNKVVDSH